MLAINMKVAGQRRKKLRYCKKKKGGPQEGEFQISQTIGCPWKVLVPSTGRSGILHRSKGKTEKVPRGMKV